MIGSSARAGATKTKGILTAITLQYERFKGFYENRDPVREERVPEGKPRNLGIVESVGWRTARGQLGRMDIYAVLRFNKGNLEFTDLDDVSSFTAKL